MTGDALRRLIERFDWPAWREHDPEWPLRCAVGLPDESGQVPWAPTLREPLPDFPPLHPDVADFFGTFWFPTLTALHGGEPVYLVGFENEERERETLLAWRAARERAPVFVAHYGDDRWVGVDRSTGRVTLEDPGRPSVPLAASLAEWLDALEPLATD